MTNQVTKYPGLEQDLEKAQLFSQGSNTYTKEGFRQRLLEVVSAWHEKEMGKLDQKYADAMNSGPANTDTKDTTKKK